ncbi:MAG: hypothetical protein ACHBN1_11790 [Heteroscytonema crispum UTEX LB 1556]
MIIFVLPLHSSNAKITSKNSSLVIIGGTLPQFAEVFQKMIALTGGKEAKIAIFPTASSNPQKTGKYTVDAFNKYGAKAIFIF